MRQRQKILALAAVFMSLCGVVSFWTYGEAPADPSLTGFAYSKPADCRVDADCEKHRGSKYNNICFTAQCKVTGYGQTACVFNQEDDFCCVEQSDCENRRVLAYHNALNNERDNTCQSRFICGARESNRCGIPDVSLSDGKSCSDGADCTTGDSCSNGVCSGEPIQCNEGEICTAGICKLQNGGCTKDSDCPQTDCETQICEENGACVRSQVHAGDSCDDANESTVQDTCDPGGWCIGQQCPVGATDNGNGECECESEEDEMVDGACLSKCRDATERCAPRNGCFTRGCNASTGECEQEDYSCSDGETCQYNPEAVGDESQKSCVAGNKCLDATGIKNKCGDDYCDPVDGQCYECEYDWQCERRETDIFEQLGCLTFPGQRYGTCSPFGVDRPKGEEPYGPLPPGPEEWPDAPDYPDSGQESESQEYPPAEPTEPVAGLPPPPPPESDTATDTDADVPTDTDADSDTPSDTDTTDTPKTTSNPPGTTGTPRMLEPDITVVTCVDEDGVETTYKTSTKKAESICALLDQAFVRKTTEQRLPIPVGVSDSHPGTDMPPAPPDSEEQEMQDDTDDTVDLMPLAPDEAERTPEEPEVPDTVQFGFDGKDFVRDGMPWHQNLTQLTCITAGREYTYSQEELKELLRLPDEATISSKTENAAQLCRMLGADLQRVTGITGIPMKAAAPAEPAPVLNIADKIILQKSSSSSAVPVSTKEIQKRNASSGASSEKTLQMTSASSSLFVSSAVLSSSMPSSDAPSSAAMSSSSALSSRESFASSAENDAVEILEEENEVFSVRCTMAQPICAKQGLVCEETDMFPFVRCVDDEGQSGVAGSLLSSSVSVVSLPVAVMATILVSTALWMRRKR